LVCLGCIFDKIKGSSNPYKKKRHGDTQNGDKYRELVRVSPRTDTGPIIGPLRQVSNGDSRNWADKH